MEKEKFFNCNMELTLDLIGGKWKPIILYHIGVAGVVRYGELKRLIPSINERVLSRTLKELEGCKIINRESYQEKVLRVEYSLTPIGKEVLPVLQSLTCWGADYNKQFNYAQVVCKE